MKKILITNKALILMLAVALPILGMAQKKDKFSYGQPNYIRPYDQSGIGVFETTKADDTAKYDGKKISFGAGFTQQYQNIYVENTADKNTATNKLYPVQSGFMTAQANLFTDVQLADGIRLNVTTYLSARHHNEAWVKGGYIQFDKLPFKGKFWGDLMKYTTLKIGHFELNYGDAHFRRPDGGQTLQSPFMEQNIMDAFATEIGGEVYLQKNGIFVMGGMTSGMIKGHVDSVFKTPQDDDTHRQPSLYAKGGIDKQINDHVRVRVSASYYHNNSSGGSGLTLYGGDRTGSNYQNVVEKWKDAAGAVQASTAIAFSGRLNPNFTKKLDAGMLNAFAKVYGFEFFGTYETAKGRTKSEAVRRGADQYAVEGIYRFGKNENLYLGARYNEVKAELTGIANKIKVNRAALAAGWFLTRNILLKGEYVMQNYKDFPKADYRNGGLFKGVVVEAAVGF